jgi:transcriptional regulator with XRE-family HTH domain
MNALLEHVAPPERQTVVATALLRAAERLGVSARELSDIVGASEATLSRLKQGATATRLSAKSYELALLFIRLYRSLDAIVGGDERSAREWLRNRNSALGGIPLDSLRTINGLMHVLAYLDARRAPV